jgi:hypothetical protein
MRPIARDPGDRTTVTPLHLLLGRASVEVPKMKLDEVPQLTRRLEFVAEAKKQFWAKWMQQVFSGRMLFHKWTKTERSVAVGDVVYLGEAENKDPSYRMGVVEEVRPGEAGYVRTVNIRYTNFGKKPEEWSPPNVMTRPIHKMAFIVTAGYTFEKDVRGCVENWWRPKHPPGVVGAKKEDPVQGKGPEQPEVAEPRPAVQKEPGRPRKAAGPQLAGQGSQRSPEWPKGAGESQPATKRRPCRPRKVLDPGSDTSAGKADSKEQAARNPGEQPPPPRRGRSKEQDSKE